MSTMEPGEPRSAEFQPDYQDIDSVEEYVKDRIQQLRSSLSQANLLEVSVVVAQIRKVTSILELLHTTNEVAGNYLQNAHANLGFIVDQRPSDDDGEPAQPTELQRSFAHLHEAAHSIAAAIDEIRVPGGWQS